LGTKVVQSYAKEGRGGKLFIRRGRVREDGGGQSYLEVSDDCTAWKDEKA